jgi:SulP family sulfate permease
MFVVLAALTPLFYHLPRSVLGAIVVFAVSGLVDTAEPRRLWKTVLRERGGGREREREKE